MNTGLHLYRGHDGGMFIKRGTSILVGVATSCTRADIPAGLGEELAEEILRLMQEREPKTPAEDPNQGRLFEHDDRAQHKPQTP